MSNKIKKIIGFVSVILFTVVGFKLFQKIKAFIGISKTLPQYLQNILGKKPKIDLQITLNKFNLSVAFPKEILEKNEDIKKTILDYIDEFYPVCNLNRINIELKELEEQEEETE